MTGEPAMPWYAVDGAGHDLATGRPPAGPGSPTPAAAVAGVPVPAWPVAAVDGAGCRLGLAQVLGPGGERVERMGEALAGRAPTVGDVEGLARSTPAGPVDLPVALVDPAVAAAGAGAVDPSWLAAVDHRRLAARREVVAAGRGDRLEAALAVVMLLATERLDPPAGAGVEAHVVSGGQLWLLGGAVASALAGGGSDPFGAWADLVLAGYWPVGPAGGRLVVAAGPARHRDRAAGTPAGLRMVDAAGTARHRDGTAREAAGAGCGT